MRQVYIVYDWLTSVKCILNYLPLVHRNKDLGLWLFLKNNNQHLNMYTDLVFWSCQKSGYEKSFF